MRNLKILMVLCGGVLAVISCGSPAANNSPSNNNGAANATSSPAATTPGNAISQTVPINGKQLYADSCMICHKDTAKGGLATIEGKKIKPADLTKPQLKTWKDDRWLREVQEGNPEEGMPAFKEKLKPEEIKAIADYLRSLS